MPSELEAELACGLLRTNGIECASQGVRSVDEFPAPYEILVAESDLEAARALLAHLEH